MAYIKFGNTWWGNAWLKALNHIDYSNRLPRGARYARNGSVTSIAINRNKIKAKVQGRRRSPYNVNIEVTPLTEMAKREIKELITTNPYYISQLAARRLPQSLLDDLQAKNIRIFPEAWTDLQMNCSCPDWAVPCKHIAAVIYIIANEIDKNPFLVFELNDYDLFSDLTHILEDVSDTSKVEEDMLTFDEIVEESEERSESIAPSDYFDHATAIDFSQIPELKEDILSILTDNPLFAPQKNFKTILKRMYKFHARNVKKFYKPKEDVTLWQFKNFNVERIVLTDNFNLSLVELTSLDADQKKFSPKIENLIDVVTSTNFSELQDYSDEWITLWIHISFALLLLEKGAYIPQILKSNENFYILRWIPAFFNTTVKETFEQISQLMPDRWLVVKEGRKNHFPAQQEASTLLISSILNYFMPLFADHARLTQDRRIVNFFFRDLIFIVNKFEDREIPQTIYIWLSRFFIIHRDAVPVIKIDEHEDGKQFLLQILVDTNNLLIPLSEIFQKKEHEKIRMQILKDLGILSEYLPAVNDYLYTKAKNPTSIPSDEFVDVWFEALPILKILGIKSIIPKSLRNIITPELALSAQSKSPPKNIKSYLDLTSLLSFDWQIAIGDNFVDPDEFFRYAEKLSGIVRYKDHYILIDDKQMSKLIKAADKKTPRLSPMDIVRISLEGNYKQNPVLIPDNIKELFAELLKVEDLHVPKTLDGELRPYQERGFEWLYHNTKIGFGSIIADDMGLGKTVQVITLLLKFKEENETHLPALAIVPTTLLTNWQHECRKFAPNLTTSVYHGTDRTLETDKDLVITTYGLARNDVDKLKKEKWSFIIIDEAQNIKNPQTKQTKAVKSLPANARIAMTGTPVENSLSEYWSIMDFLNKKLLGSYNYFKNEFAVPIEKYRDQQSLQNFLKITSPFILRRVKTDKSIISDLPDKIEIDQYCSLTKEQAAMYQNIVEKTMEELKIKDGIDRKGLILKLIIYLKQICNHPANYMKTGNKEISRSGKAMVMKDLLEKVLNHHEKCLIFTQYKVMGDLLIEMITDAFGVDVQFLHGGTTRKRRDEMVETFQNDRRMKIFILSLKAGGTGLNLTAANHVIHYDLWWNPAVEVQATDRAYRIGQEKNVNVYRLITEGTFEEKINDLLNEKRELFELSVKKGETWLTELSDNDLKNLVSLSGKDEGD